MIHTRRPLSACCEIFRQLGPRSSWHKLSDNCKRPQFTGKPRDTLSRTHFAREAVKQLPKVVPIRGEHQITGLIRSNGEMNLC
jgi:hypothetical protein